MENKTQENHPLIFGDIHQFYVSAKWCAEAMLTVSRSPATKLVDKVIGLLWSILDPLYLAFLSPTLRRSNGAV